MNDKHNNLPHFPVDRLHHGIIRYPKSMKELLMEVLPVTLDGKLSEKMPDYVHIEGWRIKRVIESLDRMIEVGQGPISKAWENLEEQRQLLKELMGLDDLKPSQKLYFKGGLRALEQVQWILWLGSGKKNKPWLECGHLGETRLRNFSIKDGEFELVSIWCPTCREYRAPVPRLAESR